MKRDPLKNGDSEVDAERKKGKEKTPLRLILTIPPIGPSAFYYIPVRAVQFFVITPESGSMWRKIFMMSFV